MKKRVFLHKRLRKLQLDQRYLLALDTLLKTGKEVKLKHYSKNPVVKALQVGNF